MKKPGFLIITFVMLVSVAFASASSGEVKWLSLRDGMEKAKAEKKPMIVDYFFGKGCPRCEYLQKEVYENPAIAKKIMDDFIPIRVDLTRKLTAEEEKLGEKYEYKKDCLLIFLDHNAELIKDTQGKRLCFIDKVEPEWFTSYLDMIKEKYQKQVK